MGDSALVGADHDIWSKDSKHLDDLVAINGNNERVDSVTTWFLGALVSLEAPLHRIICSTRALIYLRLKFSIDWQSQSQTKTD
jgi:hypothetical protein